MRRLAIAVIVAACGATAPPRPAKPRPARLPPAPLTRLEARVDMTIHRTPVDGAPRRLSVAIALVFDRARGMHARINMGHGEIEWMCDGARAWTIFAHGCHVETSCDEAVRHWFDIGWGYAQLEMFVAGEAPHTPGWRVRHRRSLRKFPWPTSSLISPEGLPFPWIDVGWMTWIPEVVDLAPAFARAQAMPVCPLPAPPPAPPAIP